MSCEQIHETVIRDIVDVVTDVKKSDFLAGFKSKESMNSIARQSSKLTAVFPVIVSRSMNIENAAMVTKALERKFVSMFQILFSAMSVTNAKDGVDYLSRFHTNIKLGGNAVDNMSLLLHRQLRENIGCDRLRKHAEYDHRLLRIQFLYKLGDVDLIQLQKSFFQLTVLFLIRQF